MISRIVSRFALPQSSPTFGFRGAPFSSTDSVVAERVPKGTQQPTPSSCWGGSQALSPTGKRACRGLRAFDPDIIISEKHVYCISFFPLSRVRKQTDDFRIFKRLFPALHGSGQIRIRQVPVRILITVFDYSKFRKFASNSRICI